MSIFTDEAVRNAFLAAGAMAVACAILSVFVVARRWAFMGEGISHAGFGGAGTAWMLAVAFPGTFSDPRYPYLFVFIFCFIAAIGIGWLVQSQRVTNDAAIGIFLVASLAWGFVGQHIYVHRYHTDPAGFENLLWGQMKSITTAYAMWSVIAAVAVAGITWAMSKELIAYCFDPLLARTSGVRTTLVHYLLMLMLAMTIVIGSRVVGSVLVTALLVLPAATGNLLTRRLNRALAIGIAVSLVGAWGGLLISSVWRALPAGSTIVLLMVAEFAAALVVSRFAPR
ncbi:MAG: metal ABC transporter permease [Burkholderiales bacterium]|nr:metal ABC transporter permease [Phycisphaerae bacterium]